MPTKKVSGKDQTRSVVGLRTINYTYRLAIRSFNKSLVRNYVKCLALCRGRNRVKDGRIPMYSYVDQMEKQGSEEGGTGAGAGKRMMEVLRDR